jgi:predicted HicB family RNase H-like nuclease
MPEEKEQIERLVANIPIKLKRRMAAIAALRGKSLKDLIIEVFEEWLAQQQDRDIV